MSLLTRRAAADDPLVVEAHGIARSLAVDAIDDALRCLAGRERFSAAEASRILTEVRLQVDEVVLGPTVTRVLDEAAAAIDRDTLVDAGRLTDALLDLRNAVRA
jgi:hypothetical protein